MNTLQKKEKNLLWVTKCKEIFQKLKYILTTASVLWIADPDGDFIVYMDARKEGLRGFLMQKDCVICYKSLKLKEHEQNYPTHDLELEAIIHALKMWRHYLMGKKFLLKTNNMSLKYLFHQLDLNTRQARWLDFLSEYHFELKHIKGNENKIVDALIWWAHMLYEVNLSQTNSDLHDRIRTTNRVDGF